MATIRAITQGDAMGTWYVHRSDNTTELVEMWTSEMQAWHDTFYSTKEGK